MKHLIFVFCVGSLFSLAAPDGYVCSRVTPEVPHAFREAQAVFVGEVVEIVESHSYNQKAPLADLLYYDQIQSEQILEGG